MNQKQSRLALGKLPARKDAVKFKFEQYAAGLPDAPSKAGHRDLATDDLNMYANDSLGDCVCAEAAHGTRYYNKQRGNAVEFNDQDVINLYSAVAGYVPGDPSTDNGTDMQVAASYRRKTGIVDRDGRTHKILAYLDLGVASKEDLKKAIYYFSAVGIGFNFPDYAMDEFNSGQTWHLRKGGQIDGGHDVLAVGYDSRYIYVITWGRLTRMTWGFFNKYNDQNLVYLTDEMFKDNKSLEGFSLQELKDNLAKL